MAAAIASNILLCEKLGRRVPAPECCDLVEIAVVEVAPVSRVSVWLARPMSTTMLSASRSGTAELDVYHVGRAVQACAGPNTAPRKLCATIMWLAHATRCTWEPPLSSKFMVRGVRRLRVQGYGFITHAVAHHVAGRTAESRHHLRAASRNRVSPVMSTSSAGSASERQRECHPAPRIPPRRAVTRRRCRPATT